MHTVVLMCVNIIGYKFSPRPNAKCKTGDRIVILIIIDSNINNN